MVLDTKDFIIIGLAVGMLVLALLGWLGIYPRGKQQEGIKKGRGVRFSPNWIGVVTAIVAGGLIYWVISGQGGEKFSTTTLILVILVILLSMFTYAAQGKRK